MATKKEPEVVVRNKIVMAAEREDEALVEFVRLLKRPKGRRAREMMPKVLKFMGKLSELQANMNSSNPLAIADFVEAIWGDPSFERELLPFVLQMEGEEDVKKLTDEFMSLDIINAFSKAAQYLIEESFQRPEVQQALKKSDGEEPKAAQS